MSLASTLLRLTVGGFFVGHGLQKLTGAKIDLRVLQRAFARTRFTTALDPEAMKDYSALKISRDSYLKNLLAARLWESRREAA